MIENFSVKLLSPSSG